ENGAERIVRTDMIWTGGISETHKIAILASAHQAPIAPHDCLGPVNMFSCAQICMSSQNVMVMEYNRAMAKGWYGRFITPDVPVWDGFLHAPGSGGHRLRAAAGGA
ncbi:MAG: hypothetical protein IIB28_03035, partial [Chloroflexi bacterium]|nr:hypothetical protein [Chloroflexota bacterium]